MAGPLDGFRIVDASAVVSGPLTAMLLADQGADVIKIEPPDGGDPTRTPVNARAGMTALFANCNRGKRGVAIDLKTTAGRAIVVDLIRTADVFIENWRPGAAERLALDEASLRKYVPNRIYASISGYGRDGPYHDRRVYDPVIQAYTGMIAQQRDPDSGQVDLIRHIVADKATAYTAAQAITAALLARERGAGGQRVDVPMLDAALAFFWPDGMIAHTLIGDGVEAPVTVTDAYRLWPTTDGQVVAFFQSASELAGLARALEHPEWLEDPVFTNTAERMRPANRDALQRRVGAAISALPTDEIVARFNREGVPVAPILDHEQVLADPQIAHQGCVFERAESRFGAYQGARPGARFSATDSAPGEDPPMLGQHTAEVLRELGYRDADIDALTADGVIRK